MDDTDGQRIHATVELVSRLVATVGGSRVWRLLVTGAQAPSHLLVGPTYEEFPLPERTGGTYHVANAVMITRSVGDTTELGITCSDCGGQVRSGTVLDAVDETVRAGVEACDVPVPFMLADAETTITRDGGNRGSESVDWRAPVRAPRGICSACGNVVEMAVDC